MSKIHDALNFDRLSYPKAFYLKTDRLNILRRRNFRILGFNLIFLYNSTASHLHESTQNQHYVIFLFMYAQDGSSTKPTKLELHNV